MFRPADSHQRTQRESAPAPFIFRNHQWFGVNDIKKHFPMKKIFFRGKVFL